MPSSICPSCKGACRFQYIGDVICNHCAGTGRDTRSDLWAFPCSRCNGRGKVTSTYYEYCKTCRGSGRVGY